MVRNSNKFFFYLKGKGWVPSGFSYPHFPMPAMHVAALTTMLDLAEDV